MPESFTINEKVASNISENTELDKDSLEDKVIFWHHLLA